MKKVLHVVGARPNFMKIAPIIEAIKKCNRQDDSPHFRQRLVHTGQHYDENMARIFFNDLQLPKPNIHLGIGSGAHGQQTANIMMEFEKVCRKVKPDLVLVVGDVNSTLACSLAAAKLCIPVAHVEAGLRSFDRTMPEEINRIVTDALSEYLFVTEKSAKENLLKEGKRKDQIFFVGNVMIDTLIKHKNEARKRSVILQRLGLVDQSPNSDSKTAYAVLTLHRPSNVDHKEILWEILNALKTISKEILIIFPIHPRTRQRIDQFGLKKLISDTLSSKPIAKSHGIFCIDPLGYLDILQVMANAKMVFTDSGGIQEETTVFGVPCLTLRENTERPVTITEGTNTLVGRDRATIIKAGLKTLHEPVKKGKIPKLWDGRAAERIVRVLHRALFH